MQKNFHPIYLSLGFIFAALGFIGIFLPLLPTTPFLLVAGFCFSRSHPSYAAWLEQNKLTGPPLRHWRERGAIALGPRLFATFAFASSALFLYLRPSPLPLFAWIGFGLCAFAVLGFIWSRPLR